jgi:hypothetical protein
MKNKEEKVKERGRRRRERGEGREKGIFEFLEVILNSSIFAYSVCYNKKQL